MSVRRDSYFEDFREEATERGWSEHQIMGLGRLMVGSVGSTSNGLEQFRYITEVEDAIRKQETEQAVTDYDRVFTPAEFHEHLERTDVANNDFINKRFEGTI
jgi:hypothetical protein